MSGGSSARVSAKFGESFALRTVGDPEEAGESPSARYGGSRRSVASLCGGVDAERRIGRGLAIVR